MTIRSTFVKASLTGVAGLMALGAALTVPSFAAAQSDQSAQGGYYDSRGYYYDPCRRDTTRRETTGGILGALAGAAIGSNVAGHHVRTEGAVLGGLLGAGVGAGVGKSTAACQPGQTGYAPPPPPPRAYYDGDERGDRYEDRARYEERFARPDRYPVAQGQGDAANCTLAESPIYLPDGRVQKRFVRVCQDASGHYQVVE